VAKFIPVEPEKWGEMVKAWAENPRLKALTAEMDKTINASQAECRRLKAEVERLTKAGDAMADSWLDGIRAINWEAEDVKELRDWNAAKEGKQP